MKTLLTLTLGTALAGFSSAATITQTNLYSFIPTNTTALTFNQFDTSLGALTSITITTTVKKSGGSLFVDNDAATPASGSISQSVTINLTSGSVALLDSVPNPIGNNITATTSFSVSLDPDDGDGGGYQTGGPDFGGTDFGTFTVTETKNVGTGFFTGYQGVGTYVIDAGGTQGTDTTAVGGAAFQGTPATASGDVTITYTYDAVPEPTSALLGGLGVLALLRRRRH